MDRCLRFAYLYHDIDIVELEIRAWNGNFGGSTRLYVGQGDPGSTADLLAGFPVNAKDKREVTLGTFGPNSAGGAAKLEFSCRDGAGHCRLDIAIEADHEGRASRSERVELTSSFEPAGLDEFVRQLRALNSSMAGCAVLAFV